MESISKSRIHYIDIAKGIAMILVMLGHTKKLVPSNIVWWLYTFHMPLFFMLSGMVFNTAKYKNFKEFLIAKLKSLIIPYICLCIIGWFCEMIISNPTGFLTTKTLTKFIGIFLGKRGSKYYFSMWFLTALFVSEIALYLIEKIIRKKGIYFPITFIISAIFGSLIIKNISKGFYWSLDLVPTAMSFIVIGYCLKHYKERIQFKTYNNIILMILFFAINIFVGYINFKSNGRSDLYELTIGNPVFYYISALCGSFATILLCKIIKKAVLLEYIGRNSLIFYAFQKSMFINPLLVIVKTLSKAGGILKNTNIQLLIVIVGSCIGLAIVSETITKCFPFLIGKFGTNNKKVIEGK